MPDIDLRTYQEAERRAAVEERHRGFTFHAAITLLVCVGLVVLNVTVAPELPWSIFPVVGMAIGLLAHWHFGVAHAEEAVERHQADVERRAAA